MCMRQQFKNFKKEAIILRGKGKTYAEIRSILGANVPKSTFSLWFRSVQFSEKQAQKIREAQKINIFKGRQNALMVLGNKKQIYIQSINSRVKHLPALLQNKDVGKISLGMLYLGEGGKTRKSSLMFGNSNPDIIRLFLGLLRNCYPIEERRIRCTVQCRADQDSEKLEEFWAMITHVPRSHFYKTRIDPRTIGKPSRKLDYKGVCRIEYLSADIYTELKMIGSLLSRNPSDWKVPVV